MRHISVLSFGAIILSLFALSDAISQGASPLVKGDLSGDGKLQVNDVTLALKIVVGGAMPDANQLEIADINGDGKITVQDVTAMLRATIGLTTLPEIATPTDDPGVDLQYDKIYPAGERVRQRQVGVSWIIPDDWIGAVQRKDPGFLMGTTTHFGSLGLVQALATSPGLPDIQSAIALMSQSINVGGGVVFQPDGTAQATDQRATNSYSTTTTLGRLVGLGSAEVNSNGNVLVFLIVGLEKDKDYLQGVMSGLESSARFSVPKTGDWKNALVGRRFHFSDGTYSQTGTGVNDTLSADNETYVSFCGNYTFDYRTHGYVNSGDSGILETSDSKSGVWGLWMDLLSSSVSLFPDDGSKSWSYGLSSDGQTISFDNQKTDASADASCPG